MYIKNTNNCTIMIWSIPNRKSLQSLLKTYYRNSEWKLIEIQKTKTKIKLNNENREKKCKTKNFFAIYHLGIRGSIETPLFAKFMFTSKLNNYIVILCLLLVKLPSSIILFADEKSRKYYYSTGVENTISFWMANMRNVKKRKAKN